VTRAARLLAALVAVCLLDLAAGAVLTGTGTLPPHDRGDLLEINRASVEHMMSAPPVADEPWAGEFGEELLALQLRDGASDYVPYLVQRHRPFAGEHLNTTDRERVSYQPDLAGDPVRIAFFGGSAMFGLGQRDEHTIPSEFARVAEDAGVPVEVHNLGFPRWLAWQELHHLEQVLAEGMRFDLLVFYDGYNELHFQSLGHSPHPTHVGAGAFDVLSQGFHEQSETEPGFLDGLADLREDYARNSGLVRLGRHLLADEPAAVVELRGPPGSPEQQAAAALDIYARAQARIAGIADREGIPVRFFWQPSRSGRTAAVADRLPASVTDLTHLFDGREDEVYIDDVRTDEPGARIVAEAMWAELRPEIEEQAS
jgi:hypothetical protein